MILKKKEGMRNLLEVFLILSFLLLFVVSVFSFCLTDVSALIISPSQIFIPSSYAKNGENFSSTFMMEIEPGNSKGRFGFLVEDGYKDIVTFKPSILNVYSKEYITVRVKYPNDLVSGEHSILIKPIHLSDSSITEEDLKSFSFDDFKSEDGLNEFLEIKLVIPDKNASKVYAATLKNQEDVKRSNIITNRVKIFGVGLIIFMASVFILLILLAFLKDNYNGNRYFSRKLKLIESKIIGLISKSFRGKKSNKEFKKTISVIDKVIKRIK